MIYVRPKDYLHPMFVGITYSNSLNFEKSNSHSSSISVNKFCCIKREEVPFAYIYLFSLLLFIDFLFSVFSFFIFSLSKSLGRMVIFKNLRSVSKIFYRDFVNFKKNWHCFLILKF